MLISYFSVVAMKGRALPVMITERERDQYDPNNIRAPLAKTPQQLGITTGGKASRASDDSGESGPDRSMAIINQTEQYYTQLNPAMSEPILGSVAAMMHVPFFSQHFKLEQGRKFTAAPMPEGPDMLLNFRVARQERAFALMGVPLSMISNNTSTNQGKSKSPQGTNSNTFVVFDNAQMALKAELLAAIKSLFYSIHLQVHLEEYLHETDPRQWNVEDAAKSAEVLIEIPAIPDQETLLSLYTQGFLKYEALVQYLASKHGISPSSFLTTPALSIKEANGEFADPPAKKLRK
jgi:hypothetical protein